MAPEGDVAALQQLQQKTFAVSDVWYEQQLLSVHHSFIDLQQRETQQTRANEKKGVSEPKPP